MYRLFDVSGAEVNIKCFTGSSGSGEVQKGTRIEKSVAIGCGMVAETVPETASTGCECLWSGSRLTYPGQLFMSMAITPSSAEIQATWI